MQSTPLQSAQHRSWSRKITALELDFCESRYVRGSPLISTKSTSARVRPIRSFNLSWIRCGAAYSGRLRQLPPVPCAEATGLVPVFFLVGGFWWQ
jgi:hypothetical protein